MKIPQDPSATVQILGQSKIGKDTILGWNVIVGHPNKDSLIIIL